MTPWTALHRLNELKWLNEPKWSTQGQTLSVQTGDQTDFWRGTHYGFVRDSGHFLHTDPLTECTAQVRVHGQYKALYDQAGLMIRSSPQCWVKTGVEFVGVQQLSAVVTRDFSDWNVRPLGLAAYVDLKMTRLGNALSIQVRLPAGEAEQHWELLRLAYYPPDLPAEVGIYACSPQRAGFEVHFTDFQIGPPEEGKLY